ncbi:MAG: hypothetical protein H7Z21_17005, partial [Hymenobacter sp.]|nr:hypothetical protein [Hymenobacter sp.]
MAKKPSPQPGSLSEAARAGLLAFGARTGLPLAAADYAPLFRMAREEWFAPKVPLLQAGAPCERVYLVLSGVARHCCTYGGRYHTVGFSLPQGLLTDPTSFFGQTPAQLDLVAVTPL